MKTRTTTKLTTMVLAAMFLFSGMMNTSSAQALTMGRDKAKVTLAVQNLKAGITSENPGVRRSAIPPETKTQRIECQRR